MEEETEKADWTYDTPEETSVRENRMNMKDLTRARPLVVDTSYRDADGSRVTEYSLNPADELTTLNESEYATQILKFNIPIKTRLYTTRKKRS